MVSTTECVTLITKDKVAQAILIMRTQVYANTYARKTICFRLSRLRNNVKTVFPCMGIPMLNV